MRTSGQELFGDDFGNVNMNLVLHDYRELGFILFGMWGIVVKKENALKIGIW